MVSRYTPDGAKCCICGGNDAWYKYPNTKNWDGSSFSCNICYLRNYRKENDSWKKKKYPKRLYRIPEDAKCYICKNNATCRHIYDGKWDGKSFLCNSCYGKIYRENNIDIVKRHNDELSKVSSWKNGELDPYTSSGKGYIVEQFTCKTLDIDNLNVKDNTFRAKYDAINHLKYGNIQIKGASYNTTEMTWNRTIGESGLGQEFDTLILVCTDRYMPWKNVKRVYAIPEIEVYGKRSVTIYKNPSPSIGSKWEEFRIDEKPFNMVYHNITIEDCPALRKDKFENWLRLMRTYQGIC